MKRTRRWLLSAAPAAAMAALVDIVNVDKAKANADKAKPVPSAYFHYKDPSTEFPVLRLTDPAFTSLLPAHYGRAVSHKGTFLLYSSDVAGRMEAFRMEAKNGVSRQLTEQERLDPASLTLSTDERSFCCIAAGRLLSVNLGNGRVREVYRIPEGFESGSGMSLAADGLYAALIEKTLMEKLIEKKRSTHRLRLIRMADGTATTLAESDVSEPGREMRDPIIRPGRAAVLYSREGGLWLANYDGQQNYRLHLAEGESGPANWSPDGRSVLYLNYPADRRKLHNIREFVPDTNEDASVADTTQFVAFERNADASVFTGASGSKASPHVLLLVRAVKRELTLCEHRASDPRMVSPIFSPNSQNVFFVSDQHGKPAIYSMAVEKFVSETDSTQ
jgi:oligogalacturonide lyase